MLAGLCVRWKKTCASGETKKTCASGDMQETLEQYGVPASLQMFDAEPGVEDLAIAVKLMPLKDIIVYRPGSLFHRDVSILI